MMYMISENLVPLTNTDPWPEQYPSPQVSKGPTVTTVHCAVRILPDVIRKYLDYRSRRYILV
jgi:hypothetical protein